jgi:hypothetical protein
MEETLNDIKMLNMIQDFADIKHLSRQIIIGEISLDRGITRINRLAMKHGHGVPPREDLN